MPGRRVPSTNISADFTKLLSLYVRVVNARAGKSIPAEQTWLNHSEVLSVKLAGHLAAMQRLADPVELSDGRDSASFIDHASLAVVTRAALETYLVFFHLYGCSDRGLSEVRHAAWRLGGLADRQKYSAAQPENRRKLEEEAMHIERLRTEIKESSSINQYSSNQQKRLLVGDWRAGMAWWEIGCAAGFHPVYLRNTYNYLCGYSHSSFLSAMQIDQAREPDVQEEFASGMLEVGMMLMAHFVFTYTELFPDTADPLSHDADARAIAEKWRFGREEMDAIYGSSDR